MILDPWLAVMQKIGMQKTSLNAHHYIASVCSTEVSLLKPLVAACRGTSGYLMKRKRNSGGRKQCSTSRLQRLMTRVY